MSYRQEIQPPLYDVREAEKQNPPHRKEFTIGGFPLPFVLVMTVIAAGVLMLVAKAFGLF